MNIVLIGYRGSGKTTVGRKLANQLWRSFVDLDDLIVRKAGKTIREIFAQDGEEHFRNLETSALGDALRLEDHVIAMGGGVIVREQNRTMLKSAGCRTIYLRCEPQALLARIQADAATGDNRPPLTALGGGIEEITRVLAEREPLYRLAMDVEMDVTNLSADEAVVRLVRLL